MAGSSPTVEQLKLGSLPTVPVKSFQMTSSSRQTGRERRRGMEPLASGRRGRKGALALLTLCGVLVLNGAAEWLRAPLGRPTELEGGAPVVRRTREIQRILHERARVKRKLAAEIHTVLSHGAVASDAGASGRASAGGGSHVQRNQPTENAGSAPGAMPPWPGSHSPLGAAIREWASYP